MAPRLTSRTIELRRVVITGMGMLSPLGNDVATSWSSALKGVSGVSLVERFETDDLPVKFAAQIRGFDAATVLDKKEVRRFDPYLHYAVAACDEAMESSGLRIDADNAARVGVIIATGIAGLQTMYDNCKIIAERGPMKVSPFWIPATIANMASGIVSIRTGAMGPNTCVVTACTSGTHAVGDAFRIIQRGDADAMIAGGAEAPVNRMGIGGFATMRALSTRNDDPERASRPFDAGRDGFVIGEAGAVLIVESLEHALGRGATILSEVIGYGMSGDAYHMTAPPEDGRGAQLSMRNALGDAGIEPSAIDYINAHGTSTELNDKTESFAVRQVFGEHADRLAMSSTKSMTGHTLGAAGALEAAFTTLALREGRLPPTINYTDPDPDCDLDYVPNEMREAPVRIAMSNSFGFGGTNGTLVLARYEDESA
jgi:3-oxoacyl-[acyl-carrier-protein] synthase II